MVLLLLDGSSEIGALTYKEQSMFFDLFKAFDWIETVPNLIFLHACASCSEIPCNLSVHEAKHHSWRHSKNV